MMGKTGIEWTDKVWNPLAGCSKVSEGCRNCYAIRQARRMDGLGIGYDGTTVPGPNWSSKINLLHDKLYEPFRWKKPCRVFVNSMSDLFHADVPESFIDGVFGVMMLAVEHTFQVLTKRPARMAAYASDKGTPERVWRAGLAMLGPPGIWPRISWPLSNVWLGASVENQVAADERIPHLLRTPAAVRFLSMEPLLGPVDLRRLIDADGLTNALTGQGFAEGRNEPSEGERVQWTIVGGESGPGARPMHPDWARSIRDQCHAAGVPFFFKQWGAFVPRGQEPPGFKLRGEYAGLGAVDQDGGWQAVGEECWGSVDVMEGRKSETGRLLDGRTHDEYPAVVV